MRERGTPVASSTARLPTSTTTSCTHPTPISSRMRNHTPRQNATPAKAYTAVNTQLAATRTH